MSTVQTVAAVLSMLHDFGLDPALFGGWAEEAHGLCAPRPHRDIDLVVEADSFSVIDEFLTSGRIADEIIGKRFHHKRAFVHDGIMVEINLVEPRGGLPVTCFWGDIEHVWLQPLTCTAYLNGHGVRAVTWENLKAFRLSHKSHQPRRWKDPGSRVQPVRVEEADQRD